MIEFSLITFNIHKGMDWRGRKFTFQKIKDALESEGTEFVFLQEVHGENLKHAQKFDVASQFEELADSMWEHYRYSKNAIYQNGHHGNVILGKFPIVFSEKIDMTLNKLEQRGLLYAKFELADVGKDLHCFCAHLNLMEKDRVKQYAIIIDEISKRTTKDDLIIVAGDFNDWKQKACDHLTEGYGLTEAYKSIHGKYAKTFNNLFPLLALDRVYVQNLEVLQAEVLDNKAWRELSDHLPLKITLKI
ncbi:MAG: endonuclease/exonuclease/phosphatase family protein [Halobacteriovoraceae bacterium]|nr:endonuclease/exonuclease/phosphatase family protein [Halobacteriovoraceae bacterium]